MRFSDFLMRHRLLLPIGLLSLLLHLVALAWVDLRFSWPAPRSDATPLAVRLAPSVAMAPPVPVPPSVPDFVDVFSSQEVAVFAPAPMSESRQDPPAPSAAPAAAPDGADAPPHIDNDTGNDSDSDSEGESNVAHAPPGYYNSSPSSSARIDYRITRAGPDTAARADGTAQLDWWTDGSTYRLELDGILGKMDSAGEFDDLGVAPLRAREAFGPGLASIVFERRANLIVSGIGAWKTSLLAGSQDTASVLMQLSGMGRVRPTQFLSEVSIWVAGAAGARVERYQEVGRENIVTGIGALETMRVARLEAPDRPGAPLLEIWLAPAHAWLPVQFRLTASDGQVLTQTATAIRR